MCIKNNRHRRREISGHKMKTGKRLFIIELMTSRMKRSLLPTIEELGREAGYKHRDFAVSLRTNARHGPLKKRYSNPTFPTPWWGTKFYSRKEIRDVICLSELDCQPQ